MNGSLKSKFLYLSVNLIAFGILLEFGFVIADQLWGLQASGDLIQYCSQAFRGGSAGQALVVAFFDGLIAYSLIRMSRRIFKQAYLGKRMARWLGAQRHEEATRQLQARYPDLGADLVVVDAPAFVAMAAGLGRPRIILSTHVIQRFTDQELRAILLHERHHCRHKDPLKLFVLAVVTDGLGYIPLINGLANSYRIWRELLADRYVMRTMDSAYALGSVLLKVSGATGKQTLAGVSFANVAINYRIQQIVEPTRPIRIPVLEGRQALLSLAVLLFMLSFVLGGCN